MLSSKPIRFVFVYIMGRLVVVSNRLPVTIEQDDEGFHYKGSSGGLVSALTSLKESMKFLWVGWPGIDKMPNNYL